MSAFELHFRSGTVSGSGTDIIGEFTFRGEYDEQTGQVRLVKQYLGKHRVKYDGKPDGEGCIIGTWSIDDDWRGPFRLHPTLPKPTGDEPIHDLWK